MTTDFIGKPLSRVDGRQKVTGGAPYAAEFDAPASAGAGATYAAEFKMPDLAHAAIVRSTVAKGRIASIDSASAERAPGVIAVLTHRNAPRLAYRPHKGFTDPMVGERLHVLQDDRVTHQGQPIGLVVAETVEQVRHAADLVRVTYSAAPAQTDIEHATPVLPTEQKTDQGETQPPESRRGNAENAFAQAEVKVDQSYVIPRENHNPIEMHATIAAWDGDRLTLWDKTQWVGGVAEEIAAVFGIAAKGRTASPTEFPSGERPFHFARRDAERDAVAVERIRPTSGGTRRGRGFVHRRRYARDRPRPSPCDASPGPSD